MEIEVKKEQQVWPLVHLDDLKKEIQDDTEESCLTQSINTELHQVKKELLNEAISIDVDDIYDCSYCGEIFNSELILSQHQAKSHPILSNDNNKIQDVKIEDIKLKDEPMNVDEPKLKSNLFDKVLSVVVERILECSYCGQIFYSNIKLTDHEAKCQSSLSNSDSPSSPIKQIQPDTLHSKTTELKLSIKNENNTSIVSSQSKLDNIVPTSSKFPVNLPEKLQENIESIKLENVPQPSSSLSSVGVMNNQNLSSSSVETSLTSSINIDDNLIRDRKKVYNLREQIKKPDRLSDHITKDNQLKKVKVEELFDYSSDESTDSAKSIVVNNERAIIKLPSTSKEPEPVKFVRELICQFCNETFDCNNLRLNHIKNMHNLSLISCQLCPFETEWHVTFRKHIQMHQAKNIIPIITKCEICKRDLKSNRSLIYHKEIYHSDYTKKYVCEYDNCKYVSHSQKRVRDHYERWHTNKELLHCKVGSCKAAFNKQCNLNFHLLYKHPETISEPIFSCERCHKKFLSEPKYKKHIESHDNQNVNKAIFKCKLCPEEFPSDHFRKKHFFSKHKSSQYSCKQCDEKFKERQLLTEHMKERHTAPKVVKIFDCKDCGKILKTKSLLIKHSSIHSSEFFECDYCGYKAKLKELLVRHIVRLHTKKYNFKCKTPGCDKKYKLFIDYQWHIKKHHS
ncbi:zinc finger protein 708-like [Aphidius gifuensis]|uniref:zinc finger protein 708-like n=1 Tax=Aphidius gifuensis TaxID=684658 RepID=UPI001CDD0A02|nr:zinc finger protein 708-like [Aphidius gifuensis]